MSFPPQGLDKADLITDIATVDSNVDTLLTRLTAARAGYLDNLSAGAVALASALATVDGNVDTSLAGIATLLTRLSATRAGYLDAINRDRPSMVWSGFKANIPVPAVAADLAFPDVVVAGLPTGITLKRVDVVLIVSRLFDTSTAENQLDAASKALRVKVSGGSWGTDDIVAITFALNSLECKASDYNAGAVIFGNTDVKAKVTANGTYNFRSDQTNRTDAITATGASLELQDVSVIIRAWYN